MGHDAQRQMVNKTDASLYGFLLNLPPTTLLIDDCPNLNFYANMPAPLACKVHFIFSHPVGYEKFRTAAIANVFSPLPFATVCTHSKQLPDLNCPCGGFGWRNGHVVLLMIETIYHNSFYTSILPLKETANQLNAKLEVIFSLMIPDTNLDEIVLQATFNEQQLETLNRKNLPQFSSKIVMNCAPGDHFVYPSNVETLEFVMNGHLKLSENSYVFSEKLFSWQGYYIFKLVFSSTRGLAVSNHIDPWYKDHRFFLIPVITHKDNIIGQDMVINWTLVYVSNKNVGNITSKMTPEMNIASIFARSVSAGIDSATISANIFVALYTEIVNNFAYITNYYAKGSFNWKWNNSPTESLTNTVASEFSIFQTPLSTAFIPMKKYTDMAMQCTGVFKTALKFFVIYGIIIASGSLMGLNLVSVSITSQVVYKMIQRYLNDFNYEQEYVNAISRNSFKITTEQYVDFLNNYSSYKPHHLPFFMHNIDGFYSHTLSSFKSNIYSTTQKSIISLFDPQRICHLCHKDSVVSFCKFCKVDFCLIHSTTHFCSEGKMNVPRMINLRTKPIEPGPLDSIIVSFLYRTYDYVPVVRDGNVILMNGRAYYQGGIPTGMAVKRVNDYWNVYQIKHVQGFMMLETSGGWNQLRLIGANLDDHNKYLNGRCLDHSFQPLSLRKCLIQRTDSCVFCFNDNLTLFKEPFSYPVQNTRYVTSYGPQNVPYIGPLLRMAPLQRAVRSTFCVVRPFKNPQHHYVNATYLRHGIVEAETNVTIGDTVRITNEGLNLFAIVTDVFNKNLLWQTGPIIVRQYVTAPSINWEQYIRHGDTTDLYKNRINYTSFATSLLFCDSKATILNHQVNAALNARPAPMPAPKGPTRTVFQGVKASKYSLITRKQIPGVLKHLSEHDENGFSTDLVNEMMKNASDNMNAAQKIKREVAHKKIDHKLKVDLEKEKRQTAKEKEAERQQQRKHQKSRQNRDDDSDEIYNSIAYNARDEEFDRYMEESIQDEMEEWEKENNKERRAPTMSFQKHMEEEDEESEDDGPVNDAIKDFEDESLDAERQMELLQIPHMDLKKTEVYMPVDVLTGKKQYIAKAVTNTLLMKPQFTFKTSDVDDPVNNAITEKDPTKYTIWNLERDELDIPETEAITGFKFSFDFPFDLCDYLTVLYGLTENDPVLQGLCMLSNEDLFNYIKNSLTPCVTVDFTDNNKNLVSDLPLFGLHKVNGVQCYEIAGAVKDLTRPEPPPAPVDFVLRRVFEMEPNPTPNMAVTKIVQKRYNEFRSQVSAVVKKQEEEKLKAMELDNKERALLIKFNEIVKQQEIKNLSSGANTKHIKMRRCSGDASALHSSKGVLSVEENAKSFKELYDKLKKEKEDKKLAQIKEEQEKERIKQELIQKQLWEKAARDRKIEEDQKRQEENNKKRHEAEKAMKEQQMIEEAKRTKARNYWAFLRKAIKPGPSKSQLAYNVLLKISPYASKRAYKILHDFLFPNGLPNFTNIIDFSTIHPLSILIVPQVPFNNFDYQKTVQTQTKIIKYMTIVPNQQKNILNVTNKPVDHCAPYNNKIPPFKGQCDEDDVPFFIINNFSELQDLRYKGLLFRAVSNNVMLQGLISAFKFIISDSVQYQHFTTFFLHATLVYFHPNLFDSKLFTPPNALEVHEAAKWMSSVEPQLITLTTTTNPEHYEKQVEIIARENAFFNFDIYNSNTGNLCPTKCMLLLMEFKYGVRSNVAFEHTLRFLNLYEAICLFFVRPGTNIGIYWIDGPGAAGKTESWLTWKKEKGMEGRTELITRTKESSVSVTYQNAYRTQCDVCFLDEVGLMSLESIVAYNIMKGCHSVFIGFSDICQTIGLGNHKDGMTEMPASIVRSFNGLGYVRQDDSVENVTQTHRMSGPWADFFIDMIYNADYSYHKKRYPEKRVVAECTDKRTPLVVVPFDYQEEYNKEGVLKKITTNLPKVDYVVSNKEAVVKRLQQMFPDQTDIMKTTAQMQGVTSHGPIAVLPNSYTNLQSFWMNSLNVVMFTRATTILYVPRSFLYALMAYHVPTFNNGDMAVSKDILATTELSALQLRFTQESYLSELCKNERPAQFKYDAIAKQVLKINPRITRVVDLTPLEKRFNQSFNLTENKVEYVAATRSTFNAKPGRNQWDFKFEFSSNISENTLFIIDAPTMFIPNSGKNKDVMEYIKLKELLRWIKGMRQACPLFKVLFKTSSPIGLGQEINCSTNAYNCEHNPEGFYDKLEWYWLVNDNCYEKNGSYKNPFYRTPKPSKALSQPLPYLKPKVLYEVWHVQTKDTNESKIHIIQSDHERVTQLTSGAESDYKWLDMTVHVHADRNTQPSPTDIETFTHNQSYSNACHFILKPDMIQTAKCYKCNREIQFTQAADETLAKFVPVDQYSLSNFNTSPNYLSVNTFNDQINDNIHDGDDYTDKPFDVPMVTSIKTKTTPIHPSIRPRSHMASKTFAPVYSHTATLPDLVKGTPINFANNAPNKILSFSERLMKTPNVNLYVSWQISVLVPYVFEWLFENKKLPAWSSIFEYMENDANFEAWLKDKPSHRKIIYKRNRHCLNVKKARTCTTFIKDEKIFDPEKIPRNICSVHPISQIVAGPISDYYLEQWVKSRTFDDEEITCTVKMTGEQLAEDMFNRPASVDTDFGKYDRSIHYLVKIAMLYYMVKIFVLGSSVPYSQLKSLSNYVELQTNFYINHFIQLVNNTWWVKISNPEFTAVLYGKTFSGDWCTLLLNCLLTCFFISIVPYLLKITKWFARILGDDSNNNLTKDIMRMTAQLVALIGMELDVEDRENYYQTYNSQIALKDDKGHAFLSPQTINGVIKLFFAPYAAPTNNTSKTTFTQEVIKNQNYAYQFHGDPVIKYLTNESIKRHGIVKKFDPSKYNYSNVASNPYKASNIHTHNITDDEWKKLNFYVYDNVNTPQDFYKNQITTWAKTNFLNNQTVNLLNYYHQF